MERIVTAFGGESWDYLVTVSAMNGASVRVACSITGSLDELEEAIRKSANETEAKAFGAAILFARSMAAMKATSQAEPPRG